MHVGHAELLEVVDAGGEAVGIGCAVLGEGEKLSFVGDAGGWMLRHVAVVHLIDHHIGEIVDLRALVGVPALGVGGGEIDDCRAGAVDPHGFRPDAGRLVFPFALIFDLESVELTVELIWHRGGPCAGGGVTLHREHLERGAEPTVVIEVDPCGRGLGAPEAEMRAAVVDDEFEVVAAVGRIVVESGVVGALGRDGGGKGHGAQRHQGGCHEAAGCRNLHVRII